MKKLFTLTLTAALLLLSAPAMAQDIGEQVGYANVFARVQVVTAGSGRVSITPPSGGLENYKETVDFQRPLPVASILEIVYFNGKSRATEGYTLGGWYLDNGDGIFDINNDELLSTDTQPLFFFTIDQLGLSSNDIYETEAQANAATEPAQPQILIWALFTNGATAECDYKMGMGTYDFKMGSVHIDKPVNQPGDVITVTAIPNEGYQFEYWKTGYSSQWGEANPNTVVSRDASYTFTVQGGEKLYAYFSDKKAPVIEFPEEGGWYIGSFEGSWVLHELSDAYVYIPTLTEVDENGQLHFNLITDSEGRSYFDTDDVYGHYDNTLKFRNVTPGYGNEATLIYGKGTVRFTHDTSSYQSYDRAGNLLQWSGSKGYTFRDPNFMGYHIYAYRPDVAAFFKIGTTDLLYENATSSVYIPSNTCYINVEAIQIADPNTGFIPDVIALSPEGYTQAVTAIKDAKTAEAGASNTRMYTLSGVEVKAPSKKGLYISNGKKVFINK